ncbi:MAG: tehA [Betaproteobacteria bacterium]|nr:tehA [Betaproteobacteria bacterium]
MPNLAALERFPVSLFGAPMGLLGLGLVLRDARDLWPLLPGWLAEFWVWAGTLVFCALLLCYALKWLRHRAAAWAEASDPVRMCFVSAMPVAGCLVAGGMLPYAPVPADMLWCASAVLYLILQIWGLSRWFTGIELAQIHGGWMIMLLAGVVFPIAGIPLHHIDLSRFMYGTAIVGGPFIIVFILFRMFTGPALPDILKPTAFILLVPGGLLYGNYAQVSGEAAPYFITATFFCAITVLVGLLVFARRCYRWPFGPSWWAFTFPLDTMARGGLRYLRVATALAEGSLNPIWPLLAATLLGLAAFAVCAVSVRSLLALR